MTESRGREGHMFCERIEKIKTSAATFQVLLYFTLLDRSGDDISYNILPQYSNQYPLHASNHYCPKSNTVLSILL